jgi:hypothetical protein
MLTCCTPSARPRPAVTLPDRVLTRRTLAARALAAATPGRDGAARRVLAAVLALVAVLALLAVLALDRGASPGRVPVGGPPARSVRTLT